MELLRKSLRETHFGATATCFKFPGRIGRKSEMKQVGIPWGGPGRQGRSPGFTKLSQDRTETRIKLKVLGGQVARSGVFFAPPEKFTFMAAPRGSYSERLVCQNFESFLQKFSFVPKR